MVSPRTGSLGQSQYIHVQHGTGTPEKDGMTGYISAINNKKLGKDRPQPKLKWLEPSGDDDLDGPELFTAQPSDDIPRNKLTERLARGLQSYVQRMQKRESFFAELAHIKLQNWLPAPREYSSMVTVGTQIYLIGG